MNNLIDLEKKINSELTTKINKTSIKHNQIYVEIDKEDLIDVVLFIKICEWFILEVLIFVVSSELIFFSKSIKLFILSTNGSFISYFFL